MYVFEFQKKLKTAWGTELKCYRNDLLKEKWYCMDYSADHDKKVLLEIFCQITFQSSSDSLTAENRLRH